MMKSLAVVVALAGAAPALSQTCPEPTGWDVPDKRIAARAPSFRFALKDGATHQLRLHPQRSVALATKPLQPAKQGHHAGLASLDIGRPGRLDVLLSERAYVDLVRGNKPLKSVDHGRVQCNGIYKRVSFDVQPGRYALQITGSEAKSIRVATMRR